MAGTDRPLISADSHVIEPIDIWGGLLPDGYWGDAPSMFSKRPGGFDPKARTDEMATDGVSAEVLYPSLTMKLFGIEDAELQQRCFRRYNAWLAEYCAVSPRRLLGIGLIPAYSMDAALEEVAWCKEHGLRGVQVWQIPPPHLPFDGTHYDPLWEACEASGLSVSLHILTGFGYALDIYRYGPELTKARTLGFKLPINQKLLAVQDALVDLIISGALDRHRELRLVLVENECSWLPFFLDQLDYYYHRHAGEGRPDLERPPTEAFRDQVTTTFFRDPHAAFVAQNVGIEGLMWSSDYPHGNSTWPNSRQVVEDRLGHLPDASVHQLVWANACRLFDIDLEPPKDAT
jgi:predicted TIM-barrel fold metal-dependent hydrolase